MSPDIHELDARTVDRIAAGEVVERPASAVKELVENSIDAEATRVEVSVDGGGTDRIEVRDDGVGMDEEAVRLAVREHTTSKIERIDDLEAGLSTLGFRGEALHAIGAVSRMTVRTKPRDGGRGTELVVEGGEVARVDATGCPEGTTVVVEDLFYNVPARRKYLKQDATEFSHVNSVVTGYALANPGVAITLNHDGRETFATTGQGDLRSTVMAVYGREVASAMIPVGDGEGAGSLDGNGDGDGAAEADGAGEGDVEGPEETGADRAEGPLRGISGLVSHPETTRASREYLTTFVNGRFVRSSAVREAVLEAYGAQLAADRYPFAVLFLDVPAETVDVNVHPRKREVRFADEQDMREQVRTTVRDALLEEGPIRSSAPRGRSAPDETAVGPGGGHADADERPRRDIGGDADEQRSHTERTGGDTSAGTADPVGTEPSQRSVPPEGSAPNGRTTGMRAGGTGEADETQPATPPDLTGGASGDPTADDPTADDPTAGDATADDATSAIHRKFRDTPGQATLSDEGEVDREFEFERLPAMRILGQVHDSYVVAETADGVVLLDQHAADERVNYERLRTEFAGDLTTQALADPVELELTAREAALFEEHDDALAQLGFRTTCLDARTVRVTTVPGLIAEADGPELLRDLLGEFVAGDPEGTVEAVADDLLSDMACYPSVTANTSLREGSVVDLLAALDDCENPYSCPHGRPVLIEFSEDEIEDRFERDYPGHHGRRT